MEGKNRPVARKAIEFKESKNYSILRMQNKKIPRRLKT